MKNIKHSQCMICDRISLIRAHENVSFITELKTCYVVFGDHQYYPGYTLALSKDHETELYDLQKPRRKQFLWEMTVVAEAVARVFHPVKMNYELLGNAEAHLHWHLYPRHNNDPDPARPIWAYPKEKRCNERTRITENFINKYRRQMITEIESIIKI